MVETRSLSKIDTYQGSIVPFQEQIQSIQAYTRKVQYEALQQNFAVQGMQNLFHSYKCARDFSLKLQKADKDSQGYIFIKKVNEVQNKMKALWCFIAFKIQACYYFFERLQPTLEKSMTKVRSDFEFHVADFDPDIYSQYFYKLENQSKKELQDLIEDVEKTTESPEFKNVSQLMIEIQNLQQEIIPQFNDSDFEEEKKSEAQRILEIEETLRKERQDTQNKIKEAFIKYETAKANEEFQSKKCGTLHQNVKQLWKLINKETETLNKKQSELKLNEDKLRKEMTQSIKDKMQKQTQEFQEMLDQAKLIIADKQKTLAQLHAKEDAIQQKVVSKKGGQNGEVSFNNIYVFDNSGSMSGEPINLVTQHILGLNEDRKKSQNDLVTILSFNSSVKVIYSQVHPSQVTGLPAKASGGTNFTVAFEEIEQQIKLLNDDQVGIIHFFTDGLANIDKSCKIISDIHQAHKNRDLPLFFIVYAYSSSCSPDVLKTLAKAGNGGELKGKFGNFVFEFFHHSDSVEGLKKIFQIIKMIVQEISSVERLLEAYKERIIYVNQQILDLKEKMVKDEEKQLKLNEQSQKQIAEYLSTSNQQLLETYNLEIKHLEEELKTLVIQHTQSKADYEQSLIDHATKKQELEAAKKDRFFQNHEDLLQRIEAAHKESIDYQRLQKEKQEIKDRSDSGLIRFTDEEFRNAAKQILQMNNFQPKVQMVIQTFKAKMQISLDQIDNILENFSERKNVILQNQVADVVMRMIIFEQTGKIFQQSDAGTINLMIHGMLTQLGYENQPLILEFFNSSIRNLEPFYDFVTEEEATAKSEPQEETKQRRATTAKKGPPKKQWQKIRDKVIQDIETFAKRKVPDQTIDIGVNLLDFIEIKDQIAELKKRRQEVLSQTPKDEMLVNMIDLRIAELECEQLQEKIDEKSTPRLEKQLEAKQQKVDDLLLKVENTKQFELIDNLLAAYEKMRNHFNNKYQAQTRKIKINQIKAIIEQDYDKAIENIIRIQKNCFIAVEKSIGDDIEEMKEEEPKKPLSIQA